LERNIHITEALGLPTGI